MKDNPHITEITIDYNLQTGTGSVYYGDIQLCDIQLSEAHNQTIKESLFKHNLT